MVRKKDGQGLSDWQECTVEDIVAKSAFPVPAPAELNPSNEDKWFHFRVTLSQVSVLSQREKGILRRKSNRFA